MSPEEKQPKTRSELRLIQRRAANAAQAAAEAQIRLRAENLAAANRATRLLQDRVQQEETRKAETLERKREEEPQTAFRQKRRDSEQDEPRTTRAVPPPEKVQKEKVPKETIQEIGLPRMRGRAIEAAKRATTVASSGKKRLPTHERKEENRAGDETVAPERRHEIRPAPSQTNEATLSESVVPAKKQRRGHLGSSAQKPEKRANVLKVPEKIGEELAPKKPKQFDPRPSLNPRPPRRVVEQQEHERRSSPLEKSWRDLAERQETEAQHTLRNQRRRLATEEVTRQEAAKTEKAAKTEQNAETEKAESKTKPLPKRPSKSRASAPREERSPRTQVAAPPSRSARVLAAARFQSEPTAEESAEEAAPVRSDKLLRLRTQESFIIDENGEPVSLRGVTVVGLDSITVADQSVRTTLALDDANLALMTNLLGVKLVRLPFQAVALLSGNESLSAEEILAGLDEIVEAVIKAGAYVLLALTPPLLLTDALQLWQILARQYSNEPGVLYEVFASAEPAGDNWLPQAAMLVGAVRQQNPAALIFVGSGQGGVSVSGLPLQFATGETVFNIVYTISVSLENLPDPNDGQLQALSDSYPVFASLWLGGEEPETNRIWGHVADLFSRLGIDWAAGNWNAVPRLVIDAVQHDFTATGWGMTVERALRLPHRPLLQSFTPPELASRV